MNDVFLLYYTILNCQMWKRWPVLLVYQQQQLLKIILLCN